MSSDHDDPSVCPLLKFNPLSIILTASEEILVEELKESTTEASYKVRISSSVFGYYYMFETFLLALVC